MSTATISSYIKSLTEETIGKRSLFSSLSGSVVKGKYLKAIYPFYQYLKSFTEYINNCHDKEIYDKDYIIKTYEIIDNLFTEIYETDSQDTKVYNDILENNLKEIAMIIGQINMFNVDLPRHPYESNDSSTNFKDNVWSKENINAVLSDTFNEKVKRRRASHIFINIPENFSTVFCSLDTYSILALTHFINSCPKDNFYLNYTKNYRSLQIPFCHNDQVKIIFGSSSDVRIDSNFDANLQIVPFSSSSSDNHSLFKEMFFKHHSHTKNRGIEMILTELSGLSTDSLNLISNYLDDIHVYSNNTELRLIVGVKRDKMEFNLSKQLKLYKDFINPNSECFTYSIDWLEQPDYLFKSLYYSQNEIESILSDKEIEVNRVFKDTKSEFIINLEEEKTRPLIPFSPGQLGLVLVSGFIDGIVNEENGCKHLIKGSTYVQTDRNEETESPSKVLRYKTYRHSTYVTMLLADGTFKSLR